MNLRQLFHFKKEKDEYDELIHMSKQEKKNFLSNDLIERMIRVEQRVFSSFGENLPYNKTKYYLSLSANEKKGFVNYLRAKKIKSRVLIVFFFTLLLSFVFIRMDFTGNAINNSLGSDGYYLLSEISVILVLVCLFIGIIVFVLKKKKERHFESHFKILDKFAVKRYFKGV